MTNNPHKAQALKGLRVRCGSRAILRAARFGRQLRQAGAPHRFIPVEALLVTVHRQAVGRCPSQAVRTGSQAILTDVRAGPPPKTLLVRHIALCRLTTGRFSSPSIGMQNYVMFG